MSKTANIKCWVSHRLTEKVGRALRNLSAAKDVQTIAVMPDVHLAGDVCNGVVVATESMLYPQCVGGDIGCGYLSVDLAVADSGCTSCESTLPFSEIWLGVRSAIPINKHVDRIGFESDLGLSSARLQSDAEREGRLQLGTLGRGNHFVELQRNEHGTLSLLIHSGSRSMGQIISTWHLKNASVDPRSGLKHICAESELGKAFLNDLEWARRYAAVNRLEMLRAVESSVLSVMNMAVDWTSLIHHDHNHVQHETHDDRVLWVHRKGAQGLQRNHAAVIPGSMGTTTYLVQGRHHSESLGSCSHGAGRLMSRKEAAQRVSVKALRRQMSNVWFNERRAKTLLDEAPSAYKDIRKVMKAQRDLVRIVGRREPVLNYKG